MYNIEDVRVVHLEISSRCNAACPLCPRNLFGAEFNDGYELADMSLAQAETIFKPDFISQLTELNINGNFGDLVMNNDSIPIIRYFRQYNENLKIGISTNGGARAEHFWKELAKLNCVVHFSIDGLEDTHSRYRRNTLYSTVIKNAEAFISAGGIAHWKMIKFDHNAHQIRQAEQIAKEKGFHRFDLVHSSRTSGPVFNDNFELVDTLGTPTETSIAHILTSRIISGREDILNSVTYTNAPRIDCAVKKSKSVYVTSTGEIYPCCYLGFSPRTFGYGTYNGAVNQQIRPLLEDNNAQHRPLSECIKWFNKVEQSWDIPDVKQGRLLACNDQCGCS